MRHRLLISILPRDFFRAKLYEPETLQLICLPNLPALFLLYKREGAKNATFAFNLLPPLNLDFGKKNSTGVILGLTLTLCASLCLQSLPFSRLSACCIYQLKKNSLSHFISLLAPISCDSRLSALLASPHPAAPL